MEYLSIINDRNIVSINDNYKNLSLISKTLLSKLYSQTVEYKGGAFNNYSPLVQFPMGTTEAELVGKSVDVYTFSVDVKKGQFYAITLKENLLGNIHIFCSAEGVYHITLPKNTDVQGIYVYIYGYSSKTTNSRYGLIVYNQDGELVFDSNFRYAVPIEFGWEKINLPNNKMSNKSIFLPIGYCGSFTPYNCACVFISNRDANNDVKVFHFHQMTSLTHFAKNTYAIFDISNTLDI